jgi:DNA polymerase III epsilon subunit-like protein
MSNTGYLVIDTETSGLMDYKRPADAPGQPRVAAVAFIRLSESLVVEREYDRLILPTDWEVLEDTTAIHGLTMERLMSEGVPIEEVLNVYEQEITQGRAVVAHGAQFDLKMMRSELRRAGRPDLFEETANICLMRSARPFAKKIGRELVKAGGSNKGWPKLSDLCAFLGIEQGEEHEALDDARAAAACFKKMVELGFEPQPEVHTSKDYEAIRSAS